MIRIVLCQPEIPVNVGALLRLSACWGIHLDLVGPFSFVWSHRYLRRVVMDYISEAVYTQYISWQAYQEKTLDRRKVFLVPHQGLAYTAFSFMPDDALILGSESQGFPHDIQAQAQHIIHVPMRAHRRSLNVAMTAAIVSAEALRQTLWTL